MPEENRREPSDETLLRRYRESGDVQYRNLLVERYGYIAEILSKKFCRNGGELDDLYQVAMMAIMKAIDRFDSGLGNRLSTFLTPSVTGELKNYFRDKAGLMRIGREDRKLYAQIRGAEGKLSQELGRSPTVDEIANALKLPVEKVLLGLEREVNYISLDSQFQDSDTSLAEVIPDERNDFQAIENKDFFESCLKLLTQPEQTLIQLRFVEELSQMETAKRLNVSQMFVSRLERKILTKLRSQMKES